jgi:hypothetical protein
VTVLTQPAVHVFVDANGQLGTLTPPPVVGTVTGGVTPGAAPQADAALLQELQDLRTLIADLRRRLTALEVQVVSPRRR